MSISNGIATGVSNFVDSFLKQRREEKELQTKIAMIESGMNVELSDIDRLITAKQLPESCKFCAAPLEFARCEYCGRLNRT